MQLQMHPSVLVLAHRYVQHRNDKYLVSLSVQESDHPMDPSLHPNSAQVMVCCSGHLQTPNMK